MAHAGHISDDDLERYAMGAVKDEAELAAMFADEIAFFRAKHPNWRFSCRAEFLMSYERRFERGTPPARRGSWHCAAKRCYRNAYLNVFTDPSRYVYVEGYCWGQGHGPIPHAWFVDQQRPRLALDTTLDRADTYCYFGAPLRFEYVQGWAAQTGVYDSVLDTWESGCPIYVGVEPPDSFLAEL